MCGHKKTANMLGSVALVQDEKTTWVTIFINVVVTDMPLMTNHMYIINVVVTNTCHK